MHSRFALYSGALDVWVMQYSHWGENNSALSPHLLNVRPKVMFPYAFYFTVFSEANFSISTCSFSSSRIRYMSMALSLQWFNKGHHIISKLSYFHSSKMASFPGGCYVFFSKIDLWGNSVLTWSSDYSSIYWEPTFQQEEICTAWVYTETFHSDLSSWIINCTWTGLSDLILNLSIPFTFSQISICILLLLSFSANHLLFSTYLFFFFLPQLLGKMHGYYLYLSLKFSISRFLC